MYCHARHGDHDSPLAWIEYNEDTRLPKRQLLRFDGQRLTGTLTGLVRRNERPDEATQYDLTFDGVVVGSDVDGAPVGTRGAGSADTATAEGREKKSTFWVAVSP